MTDDGYQVQFGGFDRLMPYRVREVLIVASPYDAFIIAEDDKLTELVFSEYLGLNLRYAPRVTRVSTADEALDLLRREPFDRDPFDLIITMSRVGQMDLAAFAAAAKRLAPDIPVFLLAHNLAEIPRFPAPELKSIDRVFLWTGNPRILLSIIKQIEDLRNIDHDIQSADVHTILLVEDSVRFYSQYLPLLYTELLDQTRRLMSDGLNLTHKMLRMRARPKILLATTYEEAAALYEKYRDHLLGVITDIQFPLDGKLDGEAGLKLIDRIKTNTPDVPALLQSSDPKLQELAESRGASFLDKASPRILEDLRAFILEHMGFAEFTFRLPDGTIIGKADGLHALVEQLGKVPAESVAYHARGNHFSKWLMARTEFELAYRIRPRRVAEFADIEGLRAYLIETIQSGLQRSQMGVIADFSTAHFNPESDFVKIGTGSLGGKGRGLAFLNSALSRRADLAEEFPGVSVRIPNTTGIGTDVFEEFLKINALAPFLLTEPDDDALRARFLECRLPPAVVAALQAFLEKIRHPLAVRSSSLLEDSQAGPFAGIYDTFMLPNSHPDPAFRLDQLLRAVKLVYASTFLREARQYLATTSRIVENEKMGVIVQRLIGNAHGTRFYPDISGVAQSHNYYPVGPMKPSDGVAYVSLGLGQTVVEGRRTLDFSPAHPKSLIQLSSVKSALDTTQRSFLALDLGDRDFLPSTDSRANIKPYELEDAVRDGTLNHLGSTYSAESDRLYEGVGRAGIRVVSFAGVLDGDILPLAKILQSVLRMGESVVGCPVEIEFAALLDPLEFHILQIRPMFSWTAGAEVSIDETERKEAVCWSPSALGHGAQRDICDLVFVKAPGLDAMATPAIAAAVGRINEKMAAEKRGFVLIGPGRWGSADPALGIPVSWSQISSARLIVETQPEGIAVEPSQGTHFLHNVISAGIGYLTVGRDGGEVDRKWMEQAPAMEESAEWKWIRLEKPLEVRIDGRKGEGAVLRP